MEFTMLLAFVALGVQLAHAKVYQGIDQLPTSKSFDFIVVGGGTAGPVLASRLSENPRFNVLLVEAGPDNEGVQEILVPGFNFRINSTYEWGSFTTPQPGLNGQSFDFRRGHVLGGTSAINGMVYTRGAADDYDQWGKLTGDRQWTWKALLPYHKRSERWLPPAGGRNVTGEYDPRVHGYEGHTKVSLPWSGTTEFDRRCLKNTEIQKEFPFNLDPNSGNPIGVTWTQFTVGNGERSSAAAGYLTPKVRERPNLSIVVNSYATRVLPTTGLADTADTRDFRTIELAARPSSSAPDAGKLWTLTARKELILTAGALGTPQILLNSGIGDKTELAEVGVKVVHHLPDVGKGLTDHMIAPATWSAQGPTPPFVEPAVALAQWEKDRIGPLTEPVGPHHQILWSRIPSNSSIFKEYSDPSTGPTAPHIEVTLAGDGPTVDAYIVLLTPKSRGSVKIRSNNPFDPALIDVAYLKHPFDILAFKEGYRLAKRFYSGPAWEGFITGFVGPDPDTLSDEDFQNAVIKGAGSFYHPVATTAMSPRGAKHGVLDPDLRVKGTKGLRVADAGAIPQLPTAHTQAAVYALAERAVDLIRGSW